MTKYLKAILEVLGTQTGVLTDRQIHYRLVAKGFYPNTKSSYNHLTSVLKEGRISGAIPWDRIHDTSRPVYENYEREDSIRDIEEFFKESVASYENAEETFRQSYRNYYWRKWNCQPEYVEVWCEKDALSGVLKPVADKWFVDLVVCKGYQSISNIHDRLDIFQHKQQLNIEPTIIYVGDYDPRGENIPEVISRDFARLGFNVNLEKVALTKEQVSKFNLLRTPCKKSDKMAKRWIQEKGNFVYELDALEPNVLLKIVDNAIEAHFSQEKYEQRNQIMSFGREKLQQLIKKYLEEPGG
jgi:hypothetical protein